jgi:hypothetical protein
MKPGDPVGTALIISEKRKGSAEAIDKERPQTEHREGCNGGAVMPDLDDRMGDVHLLTLEAQGGNAR